MLCSKTQLRRQDLNCTTVKILPCGSWNCELCAPHRRKQLMAIAASGKPSICLTLTHVYTPGADQMQHYKELHNAWKLLVKRILRQLQKPAKDRWLLKTDQGYEYQEIRTYQITRNTAAGKIKKLHYMAFAEETKTGEPHLHILLRTVFIPQRWISTQMTEILKSPITFIEKIKGTRAAIAYVTKYVTKAPAQFGKSRRYWVSRWYQLLKRERTKKPLYDRINTTVTFQSFPEFIRELVTTGAIARPISRTEVEIYQQKDTKRRRAVADIFETHSDAIGAYLWLHRWRRELGL